MKATLISSLTALATLAATAAVFAGTAAPAAEAATCPPPPTASDVFSAFGDSNSYVLANAGSFTALASGSKDSQWSLGGGASITRDDNEPWNVSNSSAAGALALPSGSSATSACTTAPLITSVVRFFVKNTGSATGHLHVEMLVNGGKNGILDGGTITAGQDWSLSPVIILPWANPLKGAVQLQVRLTPVESDASFEVDDVYIDPFCSR